MVLYIILHHSQTQTVIAVYMSMIDPIVHEWCKSVLILQLSTRNDLNSNPDIMVKVVLLIISLYHDFWSFCT